jgi:hypothetical protein
VEELCLSFIKLCADQVRGGIRPYAPPQAQYDTWYEGIPGGK